MFKQYKSNLLASNIYCKSTSIADNLLPPYLHTRKLTIAFVMHGSSNGGLPRWASTEAGFVGAFIVVRDDDVAGVGVGGVVGEIRVDVDVDEVWGWVRMLLRSNLNKKK